jgi:hypothetical protein
MFGQ